MNVWATSDWHLGHDAIKKHCPSRPENHEEVILRNFDQDVGDEDTVFFLGDMVLRGGQEGRDFWNEIHARASRVNSILVPGNHDHGSDDKLKRLGGFKSIVREFTFYTTSAGHKLVLSHVPMVITPFDDRYNGWRRRVREAFDANGCTLNIHGHTHEFNTGDSQCVNVSVENQEFRPALLDVTNDPIGV